MKRRVAFLLGLSCFGQALQAAEAPVIQSFQLQNGQLGLQVGVPDGYGHILIESGSDLRSPLDHPLVSGGLFGYAGTATFFIPEPGQTTFLKISAGIEPEVPTASFMGGDYFHFEASNPGGASLTQSESINHALNRLAYGPTPSDRSWIQTAGLDAYIDQQLHPSQIDDSGHEGLALAHRTLFHEYKPGNDIKLIEKGDRWYVKKGNVAPPYEWIEPDYNTTQDAGWFVARSGFGYSNDGQERRDFITTTLGDMRRIEDGEEAQEGYLSFFVRHQFEIGDPAEIDGLLLRIIFDDGFIAYLNGTEVARANMGTTIRPSYRAKAENAEGDPDFVVFDLSNHKSLLVAGVNTFAIELHNTEYTSSDAILVPELINRHYLPGLEHQRINDIESLQQLIHARGMYSKRQLQAVMGEFWENHFTTDYDKTVDYMDDLEDSFGRDSMPYFQAAQEASQIEYKEYQFFYEHAFGAFGDLLLYSATSPAMLIYLDNVLNRVGEANENYAREILELFAFGVDNRYTQRDIEELARCFTGWHIRKVRPEQVPSFPESATHPPTRASVSEVDEPIVDIGAGWKYFKGTSEPVQYQTTMTPGWTTEDFDDSTWLSGSTGIGYGDGDDATVLSDMRNNYTSVYLRRSFVLPGNADITQMALSISYDDGYVAYLNGREIARSSNMEQAGNPPRYAETASSNHEVTDQSDEISLLRYGRFFNPFPQENILAIQVHNVSRTSSDLSILPRLVSRELDATSIETDDPNGEWTFRFDPAAHDYGEKILFEGTEWEIRIPEGRQGLEGLNDALDVIRMMANHPSTREFICVKLINKFVSDDISLRSYKDGSAPSHLIGMVDRAIQAWQDAEPVGHIGTVLASIFDRDDQNNIFWTQSVFQSKIKTPVEYINSLVRAVDWLVDLEELPDFNEAMGMHLFTRDDPDGWSEYGFDWINTGSMLERMNFATRLGKYPNNNIMMRWSIRRYLTYNNLETEDEIINHFDEMLFNGMLPEQSKDLIKDFALTDNQGRRRVLDPSRSDYLERVGQLISIIMALPEMHYQ
jgi:hypothetical protein